MSCEGMKTNNKTVDPYQMYLIQLEECENLKKQIEALHKKIGEKDVAINELISENYQLESILRAATAEELDTLVKRAQKSLQDRYDQFWATHPELRTEKE